MTIKTINLQELRTQTSRIAKSLNKTRFVVTRNRIPLFEIHPISQDAQLALLESDIAAAKADVKAGRVLTTQQLRAKLGI